jgi:hypothetical protein
MMQQAVPVRRKMCAAFQRFPPLTGPVTHFPMSTMTMVPHAH